MKISFHGAARTVTGSKHIIHVNNPRKKILLECGMFQGMGKDTLRLNSEWGFEPSEIDYVILSHAHIDHIGLLPKLVKDGFNGDVYCTPPTRELLELLLIDSAYIQEADVRYINKRRDEQGRELIEPLYTEEDVYKVLPLIKIVDYNTPHNIDDDVELLYTDCGHILGSATVNLKINENGKQVRIAFSGDIGRYRDVLLRSPDVFPQADFIIMESTYGDKLHDLIAPAADDLLHYIEETCIKNKGKLIIPAFSLGRTQELLYLLNRLELERRLPKLKYYVDSPLSIKITHAIKRHPECFNAHVQDTLKKDDDIFLFDGLVFVEDVNDSKRLNESTEPCVIISASGMAEAGRVKHHIANNIGNARNTILMVGYCEPMSLGGKLKKKPESVSIFGTQYNVRAAIGIIDSMSAHADYDDLSQWLSCQDKREVNKIFLVHGEYDVQEQFKNRLLRKGYMDVIVPDLHQEIGLGI